MLSEAKETNLDKQLDEYTTGGGYKRLIHTPRAYPVIFNLNLRKKRKFSIYKCLIIRFCEAADLRRRPRANLNVTLACRCVEDCRSVSI